MSLVHSLRGEEFQREKSNSCYTGHCDYRYSRYCYFPIDGCINNLLLMLLTAFYDPDVSLVLDI